MTVTARDWMEQAACRSVPGMMDFPEGGGHSPGDVYSVWRLCAGCPVVDNCDEFVRTLYRGEGLGHPWGMWGGRWWGHRGLAKACAKCGAPIMNGKCVQRTELEEDCSDAQYMLRRRSLRMMRG